MRGIQPDAVAPARATVSRPMYAPRYSWPPSLPRGPPSLASLRFAAKDGAVSCQDVNPYSAEAQAILEDGVRLCTNASHGRVELRFSDARDRSILLRVSGPHVQTALFERDSPSTAVWSAGFHVCKAGDYAMHVLRVMDEPWAGEPHRRPGLQVMPSCATHHLPNSTFVKRHSWTVLSDAPMSPICPRGLWSWREPEHLEPSALAHRRSMDAIQIGMHPRWSTMGIDFAGLRFRGLAAHVRFDGPQALANSPLSHGTRVCILGDSTADRFATALNVLANVDKPSAEQPRDCDTIAEEAAQFVNNTNRRRACVEGLSAEHLKMYLGESPAEAKHVYSEYLHKFINAHRFDMLTDRRAVHVSPKTDGSVQGCGVVAVQLGMWAAGWPDGAPWSVEGYATRVELLMRWVRDYGLRFNKRVVFMSTAPFGLNRGGKSYESSRSLSYLNQASCPPHDWRFPHLLRAYTDVASVVAKQVGVDFIDLFTVAFHVFDLFGLSAGVERARCPLPVDRGPSASLDKLKPQQPQ